jgi:hypothetical protein
MSSEQKSASRDDCMGAQRRGQPRGTLEKMNALPNQRRRSIVAQPFRAEEYFGLLRVLRGSSCFRGELWIQGCPMSSADHGRPEGLRYVQTC